MKKIKENFPEKIDWKKQGEKNKLFKSVVNELKEIAEDFEFFAEKVKKKKQVA